MSEDSMTTVLKVITACDKLKTKLMKDSNNDDDYLKAHTQRHLTDHAKLEDAVRRYKTWFSLTSKSTTITTAEPPQRRIRTRRNSSIALNRQRADPDDNVIYLTYPIEINAQDVITLCRGDLKRLEEYEYFNDNLIDLKIRTLIAQVTPEKKDRVHAFSCLFYPRLNELRNFRDAFELIARWTKNIDLFSMDYVFIPINYALHWSLCVVVRPLQFLIDQYIDVDAEEAGHKGCMLFMDSLNMHSMKDISCKVTNYLSNEWKAKHKKRLLNAETSLSSSSSSSSSSMPNSSSVSSIQYSHYSETQRLEIEKKIASLVSLEDDTNIFRLMPEVKCRVPLQLNGSDCGVFVIKYIENMLQIFPPSTKVEIDSKFSSYIHPGLFTQEEVTLERQLYRTLLSEMEVEWRSYKAKLKEEAAAKGEVEQEDIESVLIQTQECIKKQPPLELIQTEDPPIENEMDFYGMEPQELEEVQSLQVYEEDEQLRPILEEDMDAAKVADAMIDMQETLFHHNSPQDPPIEDDDALVDIPRRSLQKGDRLPEEPLFVDDDETLHDSQFSLEEKHFIDIVVEKKSKKNYMAMGNGKRRRSE
mmetsp:Transcript_12532/g.17133  ORF Transcript_12532/g.17133 Transcript_12532/m.17133 type:complete len:586 (+) Transcript_12532:334-2091(+)